MAKTLPYTPQPKQSILHDCTARQILYGGAAGGGKSHAIRWDGIMFCLENPGLQAFLFRRTYKQLYQNHILQIGKEVPQEVGRMRDDAFHFINGSMLHFCHCQNLLDYLNYMGAEMHWLGVDEASLFFPLQLIELRGRVRLGGFAEKVVDKEYLPRAVFGSNPGGPAHTYLKRTFIDPAPGLTLFRDTLMEQELGQEGWMTCYIPARMADNKYLDADYGVQFAGMNPARARALKEGDWDAVEGAALHNLSRMRHMVKPFIPPEHWVRFMSLDWGTAKPFSVGWFCVASEDTVVKNNPHITQSEANPNRSVYIPAGSVVRYDEWYGCAENQPDVGLYLDSTEVARGIVKREEERGDRLPDYRVCDTAIFNRVDGPSIAERMEGASRGKIIFGRVTKNNELKYNEFLSRLAGNPYLMANGRVEKHPTLFFCSNCIHTWRTLPALMVDPLRPDMGPSDRQEDHCFAAGTMVDTRDGPFPIEHLSNGFVWTLAGWRKYRARLTQKSVETVRVTFESGKRIICTPNHRFLTQEGNGWTEAKDLVGLKVLVCIPPQFKNSVGSDTTDAVPTSSAKARGFIARSGRRISDLYQAAIMSITAMRICRTTIREILSFFQQQSTLVTMQNGSLQNTVHAGLGLSTTERGSGTGRKKAANGTSGNTLRIAWGRCVQVEPAGERDVYCLTVPLIQHFSIEGGLIVHNCYDEIGYALMSRPYAQSKREYEESIETWTEQVGAADPYAVR